MFERGIGIPGVTSCSILRVKGLVRTSAGADPMVIHGVQHAMHPPVHLTGGDNGQPSFLVFITRGLAREPIAQSLNRFLAMAAAQSRPLAPEMA